MTVRRQMTIMDDSEILEATHNINAEPWYRVADSQSRFIERDH